MYRRIYKNFKEVVFQAQKAINYRKQKAIHQNKFEKFDTEFMALHFLVIFMIISCMDAYSGPPLDHQCPPWTSPQNGSCKCGNDLEGIVKCEDKRGAFALKNCFCMTTQEIRNSNSVLVGICPYTCYITIKMTHPINTNATEDLNNETCGPHKRRGKMCGKCIKGYGLPAYSYNLSCVECTNYKYNWLKYIAVAYGPLTVFYFTIIIFRVSVTKGYMVAYVTVSQMLTGLGSTECAICANSSFTNEILNSKCFFLEFGFLSFTLPSFLPSPSSLSSAGTLT